jgi:hypothetical protein
VLTHEPIVGQKILLAEGNILPYMIKVNSLKFMLIAAKRKV